MKRLIEQTFLDWKEKGCKKPLLVVGSRQIGKTYSALKFCKEHYKTVIYLNLEKDKEVADIFRSTLDPDQILIQLEIVRNEPIASENTILFIDEIQVCEEAITSLKYFCEDKQGFPVIGAGSLLGVKLHRFQSSFPVGKVQIVYMHPMNFHEYLLANKQEKLITMIKECLSTMFSMPQVMHEKAIQLYKDYLYIGGMPEMVVDHVEKHNIMETDQSIQEMILAAYLADMHKYTEKTEGLKNIQIYQSIPSQLAKENKKFKYSIVDKSARSKYYQTSLDWLLASKMLLKSTLVTTPRYPLKAYEDRSIFKIYMSDTGLLSNASGLSVKNIMSDDNDMFMGALTENYVANEFESYRLSLNYYTFGKYEIDFLLQIEGKLVPIEVKSGKRTRSVSLQAYMQAYQPETVIRFSTKNFGFENQISSIPLYAVFAFCESIPGQ